MDAYVGDVVDRTMADWSLNDDRIRACRIVHVDPRSGHAPDRERRHMLGRIATLEADPVMIRGCC